MATKYLTEPVIWRSFTDESMFNEVGLPREPFIDKRDGSYKLRIFDGVTPGGRPVGAGLLNVITTPSVIGPLNNAQGISVTPILTASPYNATSLTQHPHSSTKWQVSKNALFTEIVYDSGESTTHLESIDLLGVGANALDGGVSHYVRVRYTSSSGKQSEWSPIVTFKTLKGNEIAKIQHSSMPANFGVSTALSLDGSTLVVGSTGDDFKGAVHIFSRSGNSWIEQATILAADGVANDNFGSSVSVSADGNTIAVGAETDSYLGSPGSGSGYVFARSGNTWIQEGRLPSISRVSGGNFGHSISISSDGNTVAVGEDNNGQPGYAGIFTRSGTTWNLLSGFGVGGASDSGGRNVAISGDGNTAIVSASGDDDKGANAGAVYIYIRPLTGTQWTQQAKLTALDGAADYTFGDSVAVSNDGNTVIVGGRDPNGLGRAYVFTRSGTVWTQQAMLLASDGANNNLFGWSVAISDDGNIALIGSAFRDGVELKSGGAYVFTRSGTIWTEESTLLTSDAAYQDRTGMSVSLSGDGLTAALGSNSSQRAVYMYT